MKISIGLVNSPTKPSAKATPWPMKAAISVARTKPSRVARSARSTRPPSIGKGRDHVEHREKQVHCGEPVDHRCLRALDRIEIGGIDAGARDHDQDAGDRHVHQRPGNGDQKFLVRLFRDALEPGDAADRQQGHVGRCDAEGAGGEDVAELVRHHAGEQQQQEDEALPRRLRSAGGPARDEDPAQEQQEGNVHADRRAGDGADIERPGHGTSDGSGYCIT